MKLPADAPCWHLLRARVNDDAPQAALTQALRTLADEVGATLKRAALRGPGTAGPGAADAVGLLYVYLAGDVDPAQLGLAAKAWPALLQPDFSLLRPTFDIAGAATGDPARFHYVVETDAEDGWQAEIERWYDDEHMPGLASVPGCIRATRMLNMSTGPRSFAAYDLVAAEVLGSPPWLAVRGTPWSDRARPHFTNTRRTMFEVIA